MPARKAAIKRTKRCALYTRKSTEEGLDQAFNSLDAQREACAAFVDSQKGEGWRALGTAYDDGGFSGGSMERPALKRLPTLEAVPSSPYRWRLVRRAFLAPDPQRAILAGRRPPGLALEFLMRRPIPALWSEQADMIEVLGGVGASGTGSDPDS